MVVLDKTQMYQSQDLTLKFVLMSFRYVRQLDVPFATLNGIINRLLVLRLLLLLILSFLLFLCCCCCCCCCCACWSCCCCAAHLNLKVLYFQLVGRCGSELSTDFDVLSFSSLLMMIGLMKKMVAIFASTFVRFLVLHHP